MAAASSQSEQIETQVLIVGGGPIGLAMAADLGRRGIRALLVEKGRDEIRSARMIGVSVRTVEFCRQLGIAEEVRNWGFPLDVPLDSIFVTTLRGYELGRVRTPSLASSPTSHGSPERDRPCPQTWFDPILQRFARRFDNVELRYQVKLESFLQDDDGVTAEIVDQATGRQQTVRAKYLVGCDGYSSTVRSLLGIRTRGEHLLDTSMSVYVTIRDLPRHHDKGIGYRYVFIGPEGTWAVLTTIDGRDLYRLQLIGASSSVDVRDVDVEAALRRCLGEGVAFEIVERTAWTRRMVIADRFMDGRVFLAGDACHAVPPNGGLGMNIGIQDAFDLGWKLAAVLQGWGGPTLLESYDFERRPASARAAQESLLNYRRLTDQTTYPNVDQPTAEGERVRRTLGEHLVAQNEKAWHPIGVHLGYLYNPSPVVLDDGSLRPADDTFDYIPTTYPGARAPHAWLSDGRSTLDLFGEGFVLLRLAVIDTQVLEAAARQRGVPLTVLRIDDPAIADLYERRLVLVRPDGHVAWRSDRLPEDPSGIIDVVRGAGPRIAARRRGG